MAYKTKVLPAEAAQAEALDRAIASASSDTQLVARQRGDKYTVELRRGDDVLRAETFTMTPALEAEVAACIGAGRVRRTSNSGGTSGAALSTPVKGRRMSMAGAAGMVVDEEQTGDVGIAMASRRGPDETHDTAQLAVSPKADNMMRMRFRE